jgi:DNA-binding transcriptional LysR family regulator
MYFEAIKIFCDVVRFNSFSRAAVANRVSQSAASQNVLQLEKSLEVRLIDRSKRPFQLTPEGRVYYEGCRGLVERYHAIEDEVRALNREVVGTVRVAAIYSVGLGSMSRYVQRFASEHPRASVSLSYLHPDRVYESVINQEVDLGLVSYPRPKRGLTALPWREEPMVLVCSPRHPLARLRIIRPSDLDGQTFVGFDEALIIRSEIERELRRHAVEVEVVLAFDNVETIKRAVEIGESVSILPEPTVRAEVRAGSLVSREIEGLSFVRPLGIIHRKSAHLTRATQSFIDLITRRVERDDILDGASCIESEADRGRGQACGPALEQDTEDIVAVTS